MGPEERRTHRCPTCGKALRFLNMRQIRTFPFCGERCRMVDLGRWLNEEYRIPSEETFDAPDEVRENNS